MYLHTYIITYSYYSINILYSMNDKERVGREAKDQVTAFHQFYIQN